MHLCEGLQRGCFAVMLNETGVVMHDDKRGLVGYGAPGMSNVHVIKLLSSPLACAVSLPLPGAAV
jgi:hypothetical protein